MDIYLNDQQLEDVRRFAMEKQAVVRPGVTPDLEPKPPCCGKCGCDADEKQASIADQQAETKRLVSQDAVSRLAEDAE